MAPSPATACARAQFGSNGNATANKHRTFTLFLNIKNPVPHRIAFHGFRRMNFSRAARPFIIGFRPFLNHVDCPARPSAALHVYSPLADAFASGSDSHLADAGGHFP